MLRWCIYLTMLLIATPFGLFSQNTIQEEIDNLISPERPKNSISPEQRQIEVDSALMLSRKYGYGAGVLMATRELGKLHRLKGDMEKAISVFYECISLADSLEIPLELGKSYFSLGETLFRTSQFEEAHENINIALGIFRQEKNYHWIAGAYNSLGYININLGKSDESLYQFEKAYQILDSLGSSDKHSPLFNIGYHYLMKGNAKAAVPYVEEGLEVCLNQRDIHCIATSYGNLGYAYGLLGNFDKSIECYRHCIDTSKKYNYPHVLSTTYKDMSETYEKFRMPAPALKYYKAHHELQDSIIGAETKARIAELNVQFEAEKKDRELAMQKIEIENLQHKARYDKLQKIILVLGGVLFTIIAWLIYSKMKADIKRRREIHQLEKELIAEKLKEETLAKENIQQELNYKSRHLTDYAMEIVQKNQFLEELIEGLNSLQKVKPESIKKRVKELSIFAVSHLHVNEDLQIFQQGVEEVNLDFYQKLEETFPNLTKNDLQLCGLIRLNLHSKEIAALRNVSTEAVKMARYRLRKKLDISPEVDIVHFLKDIS